MRKKPNRKHNARATKAATRSTTIPTARGVRAIALTPTPKGLAMNTSLEDVRKGLAAILKKMGVPYWPGALRWNGSGIAPSKITLALAQEQGWHFYGDEEDWTSFNTSFRQHIDSALRIGRAPGREVAFVEEDVLQMLRNVHMDWLNTIPKKHAHFPLWLDTIGRPDIPVDQPGSGISKALPSGEHDGLRHGSVGVNGLSLQLWIHTSRQSSKRLVCSFGDEPSVYPDPDLQFRPEQDDEIYAYSRALTFRSLTENESELCRDRATGSMISDLLHVSGSDSLAMHDNLFLDLLCLHGCQVLSEAAVRSTKASEGMPMLVGAPLVSVGEGKWKDSCNPARLTEKRATREVFESNRQHALAQAATALHPTLILLVLSLYHRNEAGNPSSKPFLPYDFDRSRMRKLPEFAFIYSVIYETVSIIICANYPLVDKETRQWKFACMPLARFSTRGTQPNSMAMANALMVVHRHNERLMHYWDSVRWPSILKDNVKLRKRSSR